MNKSLESLGRVTHTQAFLSNIVARDCKAFNVPKNRRNLKYNCDSLAVLF